MGVGKKSHHAISTGADPEPGQCAGGVLGLADVIAVAEPLGLACSELTGHNHHTRRIWTPAMAPCGSYPRLRM